MNQGETDICVVGGAGHVGLPLSLVFASKGQRVRIFDIDQRALDAIALGRMPFMERGAQPLLDAVLKGGRLEMTSNPSAVAGAKTVILTIGTPIDEFLNPTLRMIKQCVDMLLRHFSFDDQPACALPLSWHIADELAPKLTAKGFKGRYTAPLPAPRIL